MNSTRARAYLDTTTKAALDSFPPRRSSGERVRRGKILPPIKAPTSNLQTPEKLQVPNTKHEAPNSREVPSSKLEALAAVWSLEFGISLVFGAWFLVFRFWDFSGAWGLVLGVSLSGGSTA